MKKNDSNIKKAIKYLNNDECIAIPTETVYGLAGKYLIKLGAKNVLIKGGHLNYKIIQDVFINKKEITIFKNKKINTKNSHGTGCTLSSAITTYFSCGKTLKKSCEMAIKYVNHSLRTQPNLGKGHGPVNHLNSIKIKKNFR